MITIRQFKAFIVILMFTVAQTRGFAQEPEAPPHETEGPGGAAAPVGDPPARVGRLSYISGSVSFKPGGIDEWTHAALNRPVTRGDSLWTDDRSRAEVHVGTLAIRLAPRSSLYVSNLDDNTVQVSLTQGTVEVRVRDIREGELVEMDLPNGAVTLREVGTYRADVAEGGGQSAMTVRKGDAEVLVSGTAFALPAYHTARLVGEHDAQHRIEDMAALDGFDDWCAERDHREENPSSLRYVSRGTVGYEDLDDNGQWRESPDYGPVWTPTTVPVGWAPYHYGHWAWVDPWGWTWVDDAPWGFAPFHYGRWVYWGGGWGWVPGYRVARPCYAPALVAFTAGAALGVAVGLAAVGWVPLGPQEVWVPGYHTSYTYVRTVNSVSVTNITNVTINNTYVNRGAPGGVSAVSQSSFASAAPVATNSVGVNQAALSHATFNNNAAPVAPQARSVLGANHGTGTVVRPPVSAVNRPVMMRNTPPPAPSSFASRQTSLAGHPGHPGHPLPTSSPAVNRIPTVVNHTPAPAQVWHAPQIHNVPQPYHAVTPPQVRNVERTAPPPPSHAPPPPSHASPPMPHASAPRYHGAPSEPSHWGGSGGGQFGGGGGIHYGGGGGAHSGGGGGGRRPRGS